jgi:adenine phosphoribosyltransferase
VTADLHHRLLDRFRWLDPGPHTSHAVSDVSGWWRDPTVITAIGPALAGPFRADRPTVVVSPEMTGFLLGPLVAAALGVGFVEAYKDGREQAIADPMAWATSEPDYRGRRVALGVRSRHIAAEDRVLVVDDWIVTGAQVAALRSLVTSLDATYLGAAAIVAEPADPTLRVRALLTAADLPAP